MDDRDLPTLVTQAQAGDVEAYAELVRRFQAMAYGYAYAILGDFQAAQDAAQEAFVEAYQCLDRLDVPIAFPAWLKRIVLKHCDRQMRHKRPDLAPLENAEAIASPVSGPEAIVERRSLQQELLEALGTLNDDQRTVTALYYVDGYGQGEIAAFLEVPPSTVKSRLHTARERLRERMMDMLRETLAGNALPEGFSEETLARAVEEAARLNRAHQFGDAEALLRGVIAKTPASAPQLRTSAMRELNRTLMWGQYDECFDRRYDELVSNARAILTTTAVDVTGGDEAIWRDLAQTLLYIPRMPEAVEAIEAWIARKGPNPERLGMLAWARGCVGDYAGSEAGWSHFLATTTRDLADREGGRSVAEGAELIQRVCMTLVDCFGAAARALQEPLLRARAARVAQEGMESAQELTAGLAFISEDGTILVDPWPWVGIAQDAGLDWRAQARSLVASLPAGAGGFTAGVVIGLRSFYDDPEVVLADWRLHLGSCLARGAWQELEAMRTRLRGFIAAGQPDALYAAARETTEALRPLASGQSDAAQRARRALRAWGWVRYDIWAAIWSGDVDLAQKVAREGAEALGMAEGGSSLVIAATAAGVPTPPDVIALIERDGPQAIDPAGMFGWYAVGREAAAAGDADRALEALHHALEGWCNPPLSYAEQWEADTRWGALREDARWKALFAAKRAAIGPVYGQLHYFPGW